MLGIALAHRAGLSYEQLVRDRICLPLGMDDTFVDVPPEKRARLATGHSRFGRPRPPFELPGLPGAGALRSTAPDMLRLLRSVLDPPASRLGEAIRLARTPRARVGRKLAVGLGWLVAEARGKGSLVWHNGGTGRFRSFAGAEPDRGIAVFVVSSSNRSVDRVALRLLKALA